MRRIALLLVVLVGVLYSTCGVRAQDTSAITGTVSDATGAVIPNAVVTITNVPTGAVYTQKTDNHGAYHFFGVPAGEGYKVVFTASGFANTEVSGLALAVTQTRTLDAVLKPAGETATAMVVGNSTDVTLNTTDAQIGSSMSVQELSSLPVYDRTSGVATLFRLQPGVDYASGAVSGARTDQSSVTVDGLDVNDIAAGTAFAIVATAPLDSVEQFNGTIAGLVSSIGTGSGGQFQLVTKSGTNKFHGNINEYHRDTTTEANTWFNNFNSIGRTPLIRNQFGGNIGGPVLHDKLFFFFDYAGSRIVQSGSVERTVPNATFLAGNVNYVNNNPGCTGSERLNAPGAGDCITTLSASDIQSLDPSHVGFSPAVQAFINSRYPSPTNPGRGSFDPGGGDGLNTEGYYFTYPTNQNQDDYVTRIDYQINEKQKVYGRFTINRTTVDNYPSVQEFPSDPMTSEEQDHSYSWVVSHIWTIGSNKVNQVYFGDNVQKINFPLLYNPTGGDQYSFTGSGLSGPYVGVDIQRRRIPIPVVRDDFNWQKGAHSLTFGGLFKWIKTTNFLSSDVNSIGIGASGDLASGFDPSAYPANLNSANTAQSNYQGSFASGLGAIGAISTNFDYNNKFQRLPTLSGSNRNYRYYELELYAGDTWKVTPKLTVSYGVRYQMDTSPYEVNGTESVSTWIPFNDYISDRESQAAAGDTSNTGLPVYSWQLGGPKNHGPNYFDTPKKDFGPRVAFSYSPYASGKTVINGSIGVDYDRSVINTINFLQDQISFLFTNGGENLFGKSLAGVPRIQGGTGASLSYDSSLNPAPQPVSSPYTPFVDPTAGPYGLYLDQAGFVISKDLKDPYSIAFNAGVQQELPNHFILKLNYASRLGRRLLADADSAQLLDVPDYVKHSQQSMVAAYQDLELQMRAGKNYRNVTADPWFENVLGPGAAANIAAAFGLPGDFFPSTTSAIAALGGSTLQNGDITDVIVQLFGVGAWPTNIGMPSQFASNAYLTNMGNSNYHAMLVSLSRNYANGLRFDVNYTFSHSIDNNSQAANSNALYEGTGIICDIKQPRACRGNSDFDVRHQINSNFVYQLPFGHKRAFGSNVPQWLDEVIGGWDLSGIPVWRTGTVDSQLSAAYIASNYSLAAGIFTGTNKSVLKPHVNVDNGAHAVYMYKGGITNAQAMANPNSGSAVFTSPYGLHFGQRNLLRGPNAFFFDAGLQKTFAVLPSDKLNLVFRADGFNVLNHAVFSNGSVNVASNSLNFGQIGSTIGSASAPNYRVMQFSLRLEF